MQEVARAFQQALRRTPLSQVRLRYRGGSGSFWLKLEQHAASGSVKDRTAVGLLQWLHAQEPLTPGTVVVESTSGNLGLALARLLPLIECSFIAVVDLKTPEPTRRRLRELGARTILVDRPDGHGGYLLSRLDTVRELCAENPGYRWPNQYENSAGPRIHSRTTGPEIAHQAGPALRVVYVPVSTGGTFSGISAYMRVQRPWVSCVAVDVAGSMAVLPGTGRRLIPGIGASRRSHFVNPGDYHHAVKVEDVDAIAVCRMLREDLDLAVGGSSGCSVRAFLGDFEDAPAGRAVCLAADGGTTYLGTVYSDDWLRSQGIDGEVFAAIERFRDEGLEFSWTDDFSRTSEPVPVPALAIGAGGGRP
jgi:cysteine synthase